MHIKKPACRRAVVNAATAVVVLLSACIIGVSCSDDDPAKPKPIKQDGYRDLTARDHVLINLERAYSERNYAEFHKLLDLDFTFYFGPGATRPWWDRDQELVATDHMFNPNYTGPFKPLNIQLSLDYAEGEEAWADTIPDQGTYPGETWYYKTVTYDLALVAWAVPENITFVAHNRQSLFTIRRTEVDDKQVWRIVEWRDEVDRSRARRRGLVDS